VFNKSKGQFCSLSLRPTIAHNLKGSASVDQTVCYPSNSLASCSPPVTHSHTWSYRLLTVVSPSRSRVYCYWAHWFHLTSVVVAVWSTHSRNSWASNCAPATYPGTMSTQQSPDLAW